LFHRGKSKLSKACATALFLLSMQQTDFKVLVGSIAKEKISEFRRGITYNLHIILTNSASISVACLPLDVTNRLRRSWFVPS